MQVKRIFLDLVIAVCLMVLYGFKLYEYLPAPLQLIGVKALLVSLAFIHAHITRKLAFPTIDWDKEGINGKVILAIALYVAFIYAYSQGG